MPDQDPLPGALASRFHAAPLCQSVEVPPTAAVASQGMTEQPVGSTTSISGDGPTGDQQAVPEQGKTSLIA